MFGIKRYYFNTEKGVDAEWCSQSWIPHTKDISRLFTPPSSSRAFLSPSQASLMLLPWAISILNLNQPFLSSHPPFSFLHPNLLLKILHQINYKRLKKKKEQRRIRHWLQPQSDRDVCMLQNWWPQKIILYNLWPFLCYCNHVCFWPGC